MEPLEHHITVARTARYYTLGDPMGELNQVWFVCHGHTYLASKFVRRFRGLDDGSRLIVAPEGLSRFYVDHAARKVGASWMTCEDRLNEISDYVHYLDDLYSHMFAMVDRATVKVHVLGFSQGAATACRWVTQGSAHVDRLAIWAGLVPPDLDLSSGGIRLREAQLTIVLGDHDKYVDSAEALEQEERLRDLGILHEFIRYDGGHVLDRDILLRLADR